MSKPTIKIYQNYYKEEQKNYLEPAFIPHDGRENLKPEYREIWLYLKAWENGLPHQAEYTGIFSQKFRQKTKIGGQQFIDFMRKNPGHDVYFINPFPQNVYYSFNVWEHGEAHHPGITELTQKLFDYTGYDISAADFGRNSHDTLLYCNYWAGNITFWREFINFIIPLFEAINERMPEDKRSHYFMQTHHFYEVPMFPFIFERLFSTFIKLKPDIKAFPYRHTREEMHTACLHKTEWDIIEYFGPMIDEWDRLEIYNKKEKDIFKGLLKLNCNYAELKWSIDEPPH